MSVTEVTPLSTREPIEFDPERHAKWDVIQGHLNRLQMNFTQAGREIGSHGSSLSNWKSQDFAPKWIALALEALIRRSAQARERAFVTYVGASGIKSYEIEGARELVLDGKTYFLVEKK